jgi:hypothetical protein
MVFSGLQEITDVVSDVRDAIALVTAPVGDAFDAAVHTAAKVVGTAGEFAAGSAKAAASVGIAVINDNA